MHKITVLILTWVIATSLPAQQPTSPSEPKSVVSGTVLTAAGVPLPGVVARVLLASDSVTTDSNGRFTLLTTAIGEHRVLFRKLGFLPESLSVVLPGSTEHAVRMRPNPRSLETVSITAGTYRAGYDRQATLTPIQVVNVPGAGGDIGRAIQSLPGVQAVDEGNGVYVRGGEAGETRVVLNDAVMLIAPRLESPSGTAAPTVNPFLLDGISFSAGSFSVRRGNALSGLIDLRTQGRPAGFQASANVALNVISATLASPIGSAAGARLNASRSDATLALRMNGSTRNYSRAPNGGDVAATVVWAPRKSGEVKLFGVQQRSGFGVSTGDPSILSSSAGAYDSDQRNRFASLSWRDVFGAVTTSSSMALSHFRRHESTGPYYSTASLRGASAFAEMLVGVSDDVTARVGGDIESAAATLDEQVTAWLANGTTTGQLERRSRRSSVASYGTFFEGQWRVIPRMRVTAGVRTDRDEGSGTRTYDPRFDVALRIASELSMTAAWGTYHQRASLPTVLRVETGAVPDPAQARQHSLGVQWERGAQLVRAEGYGKRYDHLTALDREWRAVAGGRGSARGIDVFAKAQPADALSMRAVYSYVNSRRTDPETAAIARSPADVTHSLLLVTETAWHRNQWRAGVAYRAATGRPITPILGGVSNGSGGFDPLYGAPMSDRLPAFNRVDMSLSTIRALTPAWQIVVYSSISNALDKANVFAYRYSEDFAQRLPIRSAFKRAFYLGASLSYTKRP
jgi:hypothetical protein